MLFIIILVILDMLASAYYLITGDIVRAIYWFCAGILSLTTLFMK